MSGKTERMETLAITKNLTIEAIRAGFTWEALDVGACRQLVLTVLHGCEVSCPRCKGEITSEKGRKQFWQGGRVRCSSEGCRFFFTAKTATNINGTQFDFRQIVIIAILSFTGASLQEVATLAGVSVDSAREWQRRLKGRNSNV